MKLNLGSGFKKIDGFVNVDMFDECEPDILHNLEVFPWPFQDNSVDEILLNHSLEHIGQLSQIFLTVIKEIYRICQKDATVQINVPHPRHDFYISDPTHVRIITPITLQLFDLELNNHAKTINAANSPFAIYLGVNFKLIKALQILDPYYEEKLKNKEVTNEELEILIKERNNICTEYRFTLKVIK